jgi:hypothetical protein
MLPAVFDSKTVKATYLNTNGTVTSVNLADVLTSKPDFQKLRLTTTSFPLFNIIFSPPPRIIIIDGEPVDEPIVFFGFAASNTDLYAATTYNLKGNSDLPVYQIPKKITRSLVMNEKMMNQYFGVAQCNKKITGIAYHDKIQYPSIVTASFDFITGKETRKTITNYVSEPGVYTTKDYSTDVKPENPANYDPRQPFHVVDSSWPNRDRFIFGKLHLGADLDLNPILKVVKVASSGKYLYAATNKFIDFQDVTKFYEKDVNGLYVYDEGKTLVRMATDPSIPLDQEVITGFYLDESNPLVFYYTYTSGAQYLMKSSPNAKKPTYLWSTNDKSMITGIVGIKGNKCLVSVGDGMDIRVITIPPAAELSSLENPQSCYWNSDCPNKVCGREGDVDKLVCCSKGQSCSNWGFSWCSGYNDGAKCRHNCQCTSGSCQCGVCIPKGSTTRVVDNKCQFSCGFMNDAKDTMWCDTANFLGGGGMCDPVGRYGQFGRCTKPSNNPTDPEIFGYDTAPDNSPFGTHCGDGLKRCPDNTCQGYLQDCPK